MHNETDFCDTIKTGLQGTELEPLTDILLSMVVFDATNRRQSFKGLDVAILTELLCGGQSHVVKDVLRYNDSLPKERVDDRHKIMDDVCMYMEQNQRRGTSCIPLGDKKLKVTCITGKSLKMWIDQ